MAEFSSLTARLQEENNKSSRSRRGEPRQALDQEVKRRWSPSSKTWSRLRLPCRTVIRSPEVSEKERTSQAAARHSSNSRC